MTQPPKAVGSFAPMPRHLVTVTGPDGPGIIAAVSRIFADEGADIEDISMTRLSGNFAMMLVARGGDSARLDAGLREAARGRGLITHIEPSADDAPEPDANFFVQAVGPNRVGIVSALSAALAARRANIHEMTTRLLHKTQVPVYVVRIEGFFEGDCADLAADLETVARDLAVEVRVESLERADL
jgi:glycine cleavage system transcriptional repressor